MSPLLRWLALEGLVVLVGQAFYEADRMLRLLRPRAMEQDGDKLIPASDKTKNKHKSGGSVYV